MNKKRFLSIFYKLSSFNLTLSNLFFHLCVFKFLFRVPPVDTSPKLLTTFPVKLKEMLKYCTILLANEVVMPHCTIRNKLILMFFNILRNFSM